MNNLLKNEKNVKRFIWIFTIIILLAVTVLDRIKLNVELPFNPNNFATINAIINSLVSILLMSALVAIKNRNIELHKTLMLTALFLSVLFLICYVLHKLFSGEVRYGDANFDGIVDNVEKAAVGNWRLFYLILLTIHIVLAAVILPFILFTAYRGLIGAYPQHRKIAKITFPIWLFVAISGPIIYLMIKQYYR